MKTRNSQRLHRHKRVRSKVSGTAERPRLSVYRSLNHMYVQLIDDVSGKTLLGMSDKELDQKLAKADRAAKLGEAFGKKAKDAKVSQVVFDRGGYAYIGRIKSFADGCRKAGLEF